MEPIRPSDEQPNDPLTRAVQALTPNARTALRRSLLGALGRLEHQRDVLASDLINTEAETIDVTMAQGRLEELVRRAATQGRGAPLVRVDLGDTYALLASSEHVWQLADRVDELESALRVLAVFAIGSVSSKERLEELLRQVSA